MDHDDPAIRRANKVVPGARYWFFRYMPATVEVDVLGIPGMLQETPYNRLALFNIFQSAQVFAGSGKYDIVMAHHASSAVFLSALRKMLRITSPPLVVIDVGLAAAINPTSCFQITMARGIFGGVDSVIFFSKSQQDFYERVLRIPSSSTHYVPFGIDPMDFTPQNENVSDFVVSAGNGGRDYNTLIRACQTFKHRVQIYSQRYASPSVIPSSVEWNGFVPVTHLNRLISKSRFVVLPLHDLPSSIGQSVLLQSMALGKAVIVSKVAGVVDYVDDGNTGLFCRAHNPKDLANKMAYLWDNPDESLRIGKNARKSVLENFTEEKMAAAIYNFIRKLT